MSRTALSKDERIAYKTAKVTCRKAIEGTKKNFRLLGEQLKVIWEQKLWVEEYESWEDFCSEELPFGWKRAYQLIRAVSVSTNVETESQARELLGLPHEAQEAVLAIADASGDATGPGIRTARDVLEEETAGLEGEEKEQAIADLIKKAEDEAAKKAPPKNRGGGRGPRKKKDRKASVDKLLDRAMHFGRLARKEWQGLHDVVEENDNDWYEAVRLMEGIQERSRNSTEIQAAA